MGYWLLKSEPDSYSWDDLTRDKGTEWDGVRNNAAAAHLRAMQVGDRALIYHSGKEKAAVGIAEVTRGPRKDGDEACTAGDARRDEGGTAARGHGDAAPVAAVGVAGQRGGMEGVAGIGEISGCVPIIILETLRNRRRRADPGGVVEQA